MLLKCASSRKFGGLDEFVAMYAIYVYFCGVGGTCGNCVESLYQSSGSTKKISRSESAKQGL